MEEIGDHFPLPPLPLSSSLPAMLGWIGRWAAFGRNNVAIIERALTVDGRGSVYATVVGVSSIESYGSQQRRQSRLD